MARKHLCRVCGRYHEEPPWGEDYNTPTFEICDCCGVEFGYEDVTSEAQARFRQNWLTEGARWFDESKRPEKWDFSAQFAQLGIEIKMNPRANP